MITVVKCVQCAEWRGAVAKNLFVRTNGEKKTDAKPNMEIPLSIARDLSAHRDANNTTYERRIFILTLSRILIKF